MHKGHCSGLIKVLPGYENIYAAHSRSVSALLKFSYMYVYMYLLLLYTKQNLILYVYITCISIL